MTEHGILAQTARNGVYLNGHGNSNGQNGPVVTSGWGCRKRDRTTTVFDSDKIRLALRKCFACPGADEPLANSEAMVEQITQTVLRNIVSRGNTCPEVEFIQRLVVQQLWTQSLFFYAEQYQNYREEHRKQRDLETATIFGSRTAFKPFDYPECVEFKKAIHNAFWTESHFDFISDTQDYRVHLLPAERTSVSKTLLAVSQIEVDVKRFWAKLGDRLKRPEFEQVGSVFSDSEVRHADAYSRVLEVLGLNQAFAGVTEIPCIKRRIEYLNKARKSGSGSDRGFVKALAVFALLVENVSLFSQFAIVKSFSKHSGLLQNVDNVVQATMKEELVHASFGVWLTNLVHADRSDWFDGEFYADLRKTCLEAFDAENAILDWIFEDGSIKTISRPALTEFLKDRINYGVTAIGGEPVFKIDASTLEETGWFREELVVPIDVDFFHKRSTNYSANDKPVTVDEMW